MSAATGSFTLRAVLLDVNGTLTDPAAIGEVWGRPELGARVLDQAVHTASVDALLDVTEHRFADHLQAAIDVVVVEAGLDPGRAPAAMEAAGALPARAGASAALAALGAAGLRVVALTNSGAEAGQRTLERCGLAPHVERVLGVDAMQTFKPDPAVYAYALSELDLPAVEVALLATHPWDLAGARQAGIRTAWVRHGTRGWPAVFAAPDLQADTLAEVCESLAAAVR